MSRATAASSRSSSTRTCPTSRASAPGRSARSGSGRRSPASTCRCCERCASAPVTRRPHARAVRPARGAQRRAGERFLDFLREMRAEIHAEDARGLDAGRRARAGRRGARAPRATTTRAGAPFEEIGGDVLGELRALAAAARLELWTGAATHAVLPAARHRRRACASRWAPASPRTSAASAAGAAASGCPSAPTRPGLERDLAEHGVRAFCVDQTDVARARLARPARAGAPPRRGRSRCRSTGRRWRSCGTRRAATRRTPPTATTTGARCTTSSRGTSAAARTATTRRWRSPASTRATSCAARSRGSTPTAPSAGGRGCAAARSTPSCSATGGTRGRAGSRVVLDEARRAGARAGHAARRARAPRAGPARARAPSDLGQAEGPEHLGLARAWPSSPSRARSAELRTVAAAAAGARGRPGARARRARAAGAPGQRLGVPAHLRPGRTTTRASAWHGHAEALDAALAALTDSRRRARARCPQPRARRSTSPPLSRHLIACAS